MFFKNLKIKKTPTPRARRRHSLLVAGAAGNLTWAWVPSLLWDSNLPPPGSTICYSRAVVYPVKMHHRLFPLVFHCHCVCSPLIEPNEKMDIQNICSLSLKKRWKW